MNKVITFKTFQEYCAKEITCTFRNGKNKISYCGCSDNDKHLKCCAKNCPVWKLLKDSK